MRTGQQLCPIHSRPVETVSETNWFFRLSAYTEPLLASLPGAPRRRSPSGTQRGVSFIERGLQRPVDLAFVVRLGHPDPLGPLQVIYVWFDALLNYATAVGYGDEATRLIAQFAATWPADVHLVGKDILRFHAVIWPAMLMAAGLPLPARSSPTAGCWSAARR